MSEEPKKCTAKVETYSRCCGFFRPVQQWNRGKQEEFRQRKDFDVAGVIKADGDADAN